MVKFLCLTELRNGLGELARQENNRKNVSEKQKLHQYVTYVHISGAVEWIFSPLRSKLE